MFHNSQFLSLYRRVKVRMFVMSNEISAGKRISAQKNGKKYMGFGLSIVSQVVRKII